ncbi:hypothetical protein M231_03986 [Tremella mesenterica]|uniref:Exocyst complex component Sec3 PIP2-binding N-terminal domain-containing protein n=1 Tax=Tremella mesenterica TaxID=5217 RepID=A0A4Q1BLN1_TREME|nr:hypothetical protein M231_03986 [Tremella mesenterica]
MSVPRAREPSAASAGDDTRQHIIDSLFSKMADDGSMEETLISFVKVNEQDQGESKVRYLMLAVTRFGKVVMHKAKRNSNLSFSKGKTWQLEDVQKVAVINPVTFELTMTTRTYQWTVDKPRDQAHFLNSIVKVYKSYTKGELPELVNFAPPAPGNSTPIVDTRQLHSLTSPSSSTADLTPPVFRTARSASTSSVISAHSSQYPTSDGGSSAGRLRPSLDDQRTPTMGTFGRSPLAESSFPPPRRPPGSDLRVVTPRESEFTNGLGRGPPPNVRKMSDERDRGRLVPDPRNAPMRHEDRGEMSRRQSNNDREILEDERSTFRGKTYPNDQGRGNEVFEDDGDHRNGHAPQIHTIPASPAPPQESTSRSGPTNEKPKRRQSFHPPPLNTAFSREVLLTSRTGVLPGVAGLTVDDDGGGEDAIMASVEEMLDGFDWTAMAVDEHGRKKGSSDAIETRLLDELSALDSANIHAFLESDDRIAQVLGHIDEALLELDDIDLQITGYRMQLNAVSDDISFIESQNRGLQVQTSNQQALLNELRQLLQIVEVPRQDLDILLQESPATPRGVQALERAAAALYKALQASMDTANAEVAATIVRMREYQDASATFCRRIMDYLDMTFKFQAEQTLADFRKSGKKGTLSPHTTMGEHLMTYEGLVLYLKEMDEERYQRLCSAYMSSVSQLHQSEIKDLLMGYIASLNSTPGEKNEILAFAAAAGQGGSAKNALQKSRNAIGFKSGDQNKGAGGGDGTVLRTADLYQQALTQVVNQIVIEEDFINAFLHVTDTESTFADHMELDSYFRRQAARHASRGMSNGMTQLVRSMMDLIFGFVDLEFKNWVEAANERNPLAIVGVISVTERIAKEAEEENTSIFFSQLFSRQLSRQRAALDAFVNEQIRTIESAAKITVKKRRGVSSFVKHLPVFIDKLESQMEANDELPIRGKVNTVYERLINAVLGGVQQLAKMDRADGQAAEDKGQLNYHVIMIENMHHLVEDLSNLNMSVLSVYTERARGLYEENLTGYIKLLLRRAFARMIDYFDGVNKLLQTTPASEVSLHNSYSRSALKKMLKDYSSKDVRKAIEAMSKRVDKHFVNEDDPGDTGTQQLVQTVWREVTGELKRETEKAQGIIKTSYGDSGLSLEYGPADVEAACKRARG